MKAMILAAGLGTRLRPLTNDRPKALVELSGRTLLEITLTRLATFGITDFIVNVHHFADQIASYLHSHSNFGLHIELSREDDLLLDTGGGLKKASWFFLDNASDPPSSSKVSVVIPSLPAQAGEARNPGKASAQPLNNVILDSSKITGAPFLLHNVDVISNIDLHAMLQFHIERQALATLAVQSRSTSRPLLFDEQSQLVGRAASGNSPSHSPRSVIPSLPAQAGEARNPGNTLAQPTGDPTSSAAFSTDLPLATRHSPLSLAFSGIHILSPRILPLLTETGVFSIIDSYVRLASEGHKILAFRADQYYWRDLGRPSDLTQAAADLQDKSLSL